MGKVSYFEVALVDKKISNLVEQRFLSFTSVMYL